VMNPTHHRHQPSVSSIRSFDEQNEHATDYISGMYQDSDPPSPSTYPIYHNHRHENSSSITKKTFPIRPINTRQSLNSSSRANPAVQSKDSGSIYQRNSPSESSPLSPERKSPTMTRPKIRPPSPPPLSTQLPPLSGLSNNGDSSPTSPAEIAKELSNLQAFKRMSLDVSNQVSDPDLPSNRRSIPDVTDLLEAGVDEDAARLLWVPGTANYKLN
jgi:hypothetical protein